MTVSKKTHGVSNIRRTHINSRKKRYRLKSVVKPCKPAERLKLVKQMRLQEVTDFLLHFEGASASFDMLSPIEASIAKVGWKSPVYLGSADFAC